MNDPEKKAGENVRTLQRTLHNAEQKLARCRQEIDEHRRMEQTLQKTAHNLNERVKELSCLYAVASLTQPRERPLEEVLRGTLAALVAGYQYPEVTCARITLEGITYCSRPFLETPWRQAVELPLAGKEEGTIEVFYREQRPAADEGPFLKEERALLETVAELIGRSVVQRHEWAARTRVENALRRANEELQQFAYVASHDLKAPLRAVSSLSALLEDELGTQLAPENRRYLKMLRARVHRMDALIDGLLTYSRVGGETRHVETVDTARLVREVFDSHEVPEKFRLIIAADMPRLVTDRTKLQQVFANLIGNAIKYHGGTDARITVSASDRDSSYEFRVADNGPGIPADYQERIFGMLERGPDAAENDGAGMGLAVVKKLVEGAGGNIAVESTPGEGATFLFTWPKHMEPPEIEPS